MSSRLRVGIVDIWDLVRTALLAVIGLFREEIRSLLQKAGRWMTPNHILGLTAFALGAMFQIGVVLVLSLTGQLLLMLFPVVIQPHTRIVIVYDPGPNQTVIDFGSGLWLLGSLCGFVGSYILVPEMVAFGLFLSAVKSIAPRSRAARFFSKRNTNDISPIKGYIATHLSDMVPTWRRRVASRLTETRVSLFFVLLGTALAVTYWTILRDPVLFNATLAFAAPQAGLTLGITLFGFLTVGQWLDDKLRPYGSNRARSYRQQSKT